MEYIKIMIALIVFGGIFFSVYEAITYDADTSS